MDDGLLPAPVGAHGRNPRHPDSGIHVACGHTSSRAQAKTPTDWQGREQCEESRTRVPAYWIYAIQETRIGNILNPRSAAARVNQAAAADAGRPQITEYQPRVYVVAAQSVPSEGREFLGQFSRPLPPGSVCAKA
jgi:hypothetical protein